jgi:CheY-like chemotaxis protein
MRKRRAILYDDDLIVLNVLKMFFELRDYEVIACREPVRCPVYDDGHQCANARPCADIILADYKMPKMTGIELLQVQAEMGCKVAARNKAIISGYFDSGSLETIRRMGCTAFEKPVTFEELEAWLEEREQGMDLSRPLGLKRKEERKECCDDVSYQLEREDEMLPAVLVNKSDSGFCISVRRPPEVKQVVNLVSGKFDPSRRLLVRWTKPSGEGAYLVGMSSY